MPNTPNKPEITHIPTDNPLWCAIVFLAVLAYPESFEKRDRAILAMKALMIRAARSFGKPTGASSAKVLASMPVQQQEGTLRLLSRRLHKRQLAGVVASNLIMDLHRPGATVAVPPEVQQQTRFRLIARGLSPRRAAELTMTQRHLPGRPYTLNDYARKYRGGAAKFKSDVWRPEILHFVLAFHSVRLEWRDPRGFNLHRLLANPEWSIGALRSAEVEASCLPRTINLPKALRAAARAPQIRLVPVDPPAVEISEPVSSQD